MEALTATTKSIQIELKQEKDNFNAIKTKFEQETETLSTVRAELEQSKSSLDQEMACHASTKRLVYYRES